MCCWASLRQVLSHRHMRCQASLVDGARRCEAREGSGLVYLSGRQRAGKEMNGKSANLNNCLRQLYPGDHPVPATEVVCIFDADQVRPGWKL